MDKNDFGGKNRDGRWPVPTINTSLGQKIPTNLRGTLRSCPEWMSEEDNRRNKLGRLASRLTKCYNMRPASHRAQVVQKLYRRLASVVYGEIPAIVAGAHPCNPLLKRSPSSDRRIASIHASTVVRVQVSRRVSGNAECFRNPTLRNPFVPLSLPLVTTDRTPKQYLHQSRQLECSSWISETCANRFRCLRAAILKHAAASLNILRSRN